jgi:hypothetical protein
LSKGHQFSEAALFYNEIFAINRAFDGAAKRKIFYDTFAIQFYNTWMTYRCLVKYYNTIPSQHYLQ